MEDNMTENRLAVNLTREEYIAFQRLMDTFTGMGRGRWGRAVIMALFSLSLIAMVIYELAHGGEMDWLTGIVGLLMLILSLVIPALEPVFLKRKSNRMYEESIAAGYSYAGTVQIFPDRIEKVGAEMTVAIPFNATAFFIESSDMMVWGSDRTRTIVLPARYLTPEFATAVRQAADRLPTRNRRFVSRVQTQSIPAPVEEIQPPTVLWEQTVCYTLEELQKLLRQVTVQNYSRRLPIIVVLSVLTGLALGWNDVSIWPCVGFFLVTLFFLTMLNLLMPLWRIPRHEEQAPPAARQIQFTLTDRGLKLRSERQMDCTPWGAIAHVVDRGSYVEFIWHQQFTHIPKRCIEDFSAFDRLIEEYWKTNSK